MRPVAYRAMDRLCLLQVHAHPDDEASKGAGTAARYAAEGVRTVLVTCTGGEAGEILNPAADTPETRANLAAVRLEELRESVRVIGYSSLHLLGYRDSGMPGSEPNGHAGAFCDAPFDECVERLVAIVRAERPQVVICYGEDQSFYPHPDHIRAHEIAVAAFDAAGDGARFPGAGSPWEPSKLYYLGWTVRRLRALHETLLAMGKESPFGDRIAKMDDSGDERFRTRIDVGRWIGTARASLLAHRTQVAPDSFWFAVPEERVAEVFPYEEYVLARSRIGPPPDGFETDLFEGLR